MHQEMYSFTWHSYSDHLRSMMKELMMNEEYADVTLVTEDKKQIKANINVLSACSSVFKDIFKEKNSNQIMYLRGIQFPEMESILRFIYLGEVTLYGERMKEFLAVAKLLEIKELCNTGPEMKDEPDDYLPQDDQDTSPELAEEQTGTSENIEMQERQSDVVEVNGKYDCDKCQKTCSSRAKLNYHKRSVHKGIKYACNQCDQHFKQKCSLTLHIQSKYEGISMHVISVTCNLHGPYI